MALDEQVQTMSIEERRVIAEPTEMLEDVLLQEDDPEKFTRIGTCMKEKAKEDLIQFLRKSIDVFAWSHDDMPGIDPSVITHRLNVYPFFKPIRQKKRVFAPERDKAIKEEVQKLTTAKFIKEVYYPDWLANVVMIGRNVEVYVDDMLVKSIDEGSHLDDLQETFETLRRYKMKLNPSKCAFGVSSGKFMGFMVSQRGVEANPDKIQAILNMEPPKSIKEVQSLTGRVAALNRFVSKATDKCLPFFKVLRKAFEWTDECQRAFQDLKDYLTTAPLLSPSVQGEELYLYLAVSPHAVSSALIREEGKIQKPVYYTSRALRGAEGRYPLMEKLAFALITASRKLRHYFQVHIINVMTDHPLKKAMNKLEAAGRLVQWAVELSEFDIRYQPRSAIKAQALADFIAEFTPCYEDLGEGEYNKWVVHVDGSSTLYAGGIGVVLQSPEGDKLKYKARLQYQTTNNEAEYEALLKGLELAKSVEADSILVLGDSQLIIGQVNGTCEAKEDRMKKYLRKPAEYLTPMMAPWPFAQWGLDILGPFPTGTRQMKFLVVGIDYFTKWVEAEPLAKITQQNVKNFVWKNIVCRFGVPRVLVSDNGRQFDNTPFREFCEQLGMKNHYSSPSHPQANGQAEVANRSLLKIIKTRLEGAKGIWPDELPGVLWAYRTTARTPTGETPFKLAYGSEAVIPAEVHMTSHRVRKYQTEENDEQLRLNLDLMDEVRMDAEQRTARLIRKKKASMDE
ncbi:uncharacterized protein LOC126721382 [Quercus robur]|uniref:uncharacterized protein LOC126721382 n=1 Tax=Quercus robur TaxID=38942 RepID=UPI0021638D12|nr:uncharacterized protein LOC126721382 [Quercus robur]